TRLLSLAAPRDIPHLHSFPTRRSSDLPPTMKIANVEVIELRTRTRSKSTRWGYGVDLGDDVALDATTSLTKISTDDGVAGYMLGGDRAVVENVVKPLLVGENPLDREKLWHWIDQLITFGHGMSEQ